MTWFAGLKAAWEQAKRDYQHHNHKKQKIGVGAKLGFDDLCIKTDNSVRAGKRKNSRGRQTRRAKASRSPRGRIRNTILGPGSPEKVSDVSTILRGKDISPDASVLNASFLNNIRATGEPDADSTRNLKTTTEVQDENHEPKLKRKLDDTNLSIDMSTIDEEYIVQVQLRMRRLEEELEAARARLHEYESAHSTTQIHNERLKSSTPQAAIDVTRMNRSIEDPFVLSPTTLEFSPIRVELADVSNGEVARREALQALKRRIKRRDAS